MTAHLLLSSKTSTAIAHLITQFRKTKESDVLTPVVILLPTAGVIGDIRHQLGDTIGVQMYQFYRLGHAVLDDAGIPIHEINDTAIRRLIKHILMELYAEGKLTTFAPVWEKPGFVEVMLDWVREMKSQGIFPEQYDEYAQQKGDERDLQLAELYTRYQTFMQRKNYSDADGLLWLTAEALEGTLENFRRDGPLFVLGFDQFTPVQLRILRQLAERFTDLFVYLNWQESRPEDSPALARLRRTRDTLIESIPLETVILPEGQIKSESLAHLHKNIFEPTQAKSSDDQSIWLIEAPSRETEVRRAMREVKQLLIRGISPSEIAILAPNNHTYLPIIRTVSTEYGVSIKYERPLLGNPAVVALANLVKLPPSFPWQGTLEALRSPYIHQPWLSEDQSELLDLLSRERPVISGRDQWTFAVQPLEIDAQDSEDEDLGPPPLVAKLGPEILSGIEAGLTAFFDHLTPPKSGTYRDFTWWLQTAIIGFFPELDSDEDETVELAPTLGLLGRCQGSPFSLRDMEALGLVMRALRRLLASAETVPVDAEISWDTYQDEVLNLLGIMHIPPDPLQANVRFGPLEDGRARVVDHLFVLGLSEGEFPTPPPADTLYAPSERELHPLPLIRFSAVDDASLWWQVIGNVGKQLILLRPYIDDNGALWQPSPYWDAVRACFKDLEIERIPIADHPIPENAATQSELLVGLAQIGTQAIPEALITRWTYAQHAERIIRQRQSYQPPGEYEGFFQSASLKDELAYRYGDHHIWSASRLNRYANCPYGFYVEHVLKLEALRDPEEGLNAMQRGSILHAVLEHLYKKLSDNGVALTTANEEVVEQYLSESCAFLFPTAPQRYGFRPSALWRYEQQELQRLLSVLVIWECEQNGELARFSPYILEAGFGIKRASLPPLEVNVGGTRFKLRGLIDRLDLDSDGNLRILDYKSGSTKYSKTDLRKGLALQTVLYALAAENFWLDKGGRVVESHYWHIPIREASGSLRFQGAVRDDELAEVTLQQAAWSVEQVRSGVFPSAPGKPVQGGTQCSSRCDYASICRVTRKSIAKARQGGFV